MLTGFPRLIASDLDGTLLDPAGEVSERTRRALDAVIARGSDVVLVTGRPPRWVRSLPEATGAHSVVVCANGALLYDVDAHAVIDHAPLPPALAAEIVEHLRQDAPGCRFACELTFQFGRDTDYPSKWPIPEDTLLGDVLDMVRAAETTKLIVRDDELDHEVLVRLVQDIVGERANVTHSGYGIVELSAAGVDKARGLRVACARHGIDLADVIAFGDMPNDLPMIRSAGHGVAVANAHADVLAAADEITASNAEDGVAQVLERLLEL
jgi:Cof subfamily protein (haloacid dehalogenase superfamily)